jgi:small GTP-binding protein
MISESLRAKSPGYKVCICGQQGVGKTALLNRRTSGVFNSDYRPTIAAAFATVQEEVNSKPISLNVWDTAGQEKYQSMMPLYFRSVSCVILVLDVTSPPSWAFVKRWVDTDLTSIRPTPLLFLCLNKKDLPPVVEIPKIETWAGDLGIRVFHTSASTGDNITDLFHAVASDLANGRLSKAEIERQTLEAGNADGKCC